MKKFLLSIFTIGSLVAVSQTSLLVTNYIAATTIAPNSTVNIPTTINTTTSMDIDIKNISGSTKSYHVKRYDVSLNSGALAYFCFAGTCYGASTYTSQTAITLNANQSSSQISGSFNMLTADIDEGSVLGVSVVKYTFYNTALLSDSVQITLKYNGTPTGINESSNVSISSFEAYPNPASDFTSFKINSSKNTDAKLEVFNSLGSVVSSKNISLNEGKNKLDYNVENLSSGIYFASIKIGGSTTTKKFIVK
ncbi:MAG: T9SS type A sorting domain-containing protein [Bacteroidota bacterium]|nr:T9SS type A sorting domain-containing protein [Bacteroidota bacterium]